MPTTHEFLRRRTAGLHEQVDAAFARFDIATTDGYRGLLIAHARVVPALEKSLDPWRDQLPEWAERTRTSALFADLEALGTDPREIASTSMSTIDTAEAALGIAYVLEGSRLGGKFLARQLASDAPREYLTAPQPPGSWPRLMRHVNRCVKTTTQRDTALAAAVGAFDAFRESALERVA